MPTISLNTNTNIQAFGPKVIANPIPRDNTGSAILAGARAIGTKVRIEEANRRQEVADINDKWRGRINAVNNAVRTTTNAVTMWDRATERRASLEADDFKGKFRSYLNDATQGTIDNNGNRVPGTYDTEYKFSSSADNGEGTGPYVATAKVIADYKDTDAYKNLSPRAKKKIDASWDALTAPYLNKARDLHIAAFNQYKKNVAKQRGEADKQLLESRTNLEGLDSGEFGEMLDSSLNELMMRDWEDKGLCELETREDGGIVPVFKDVNIGDGTTITKEDLEANFNAEISKAREIKWSEAYDKLFSQYTSTNDQSEADSIMEFLSLMVDAENNEVFTTNGVKLGDDVANKLIGKYKGLAVARNERIAKDINTRESECDAMIAKAILTNQDQEQAIKLVIDRLNQDGLIPLERVSQDIEKYRNQFLMDEYVDCMELINMGGEDNLKKAQEMLNNNPDLKKLVDNNNKNKEKEATPTNTAVKPIKITDNNWVNGRLFNDKPLNDKLAALDNAYNNKQMSETVYKKNKENLVRTARHELACNYDKGTIKKDHQEIWSALQTICGFDVKDWFEYDDVLGRPKVDENGRFILKDGKQGKRIQSRISSAGEIMTFSEKFTKITTDGWWGDLPSFVTITGEALQEIINGCQDYLIAQRLGHPNTYDGTTNIETRQFVPDKDKPIPLLDYIKSNLSDQTQAIDNAIIQRSLFDFETYLNSGAF